MEDIEKVIETRDFVAEIKNRRQQHERQSKTLVATIKQARQNTKRGTPVFCFYSSDRQRIALVQDFGNKLRISKFAKNGPLGHLDVPDPNKLAYELRMEGYSPIIDKEAAATLDAWAVTPEWELGTKQTLFLSFWNTFSWHNRPDLCRLIDQSNSLDEALILGAKLLKDELPGTEL